MIGVGGITNPKSAAGAAVVGGLIWLVAGLAFLGAGLGWLGVPGVPDAWQMLAFAGGALGLVALALYFHPFYLIAVLIDVAVVAFVWGRLTTASWRAHVAHEARLEQSTLDQEILSGPGPETG